MIPCCVNFGHIFSPILFVVYPLVYISLSGQLTGVRDKVYMSVQKLGHGFTPFCCKFSLLVGLRGQKSWCRRVYQCPPVGVNLSLASILSFFNVSSQFCVQ